MIIQEYIYRRLRAAGMTPEGACGTLGNLEGESRFIPNNVEDGRGWSDAQYTVAVDNGTYSKLQFVNDQIGYGYAQWTYHSRKALFYEFFQDRNKSIADSETQIEFLIWEMKNFFSSQWNLCCTSKDLYGCTWDLLDKWENPDLKEKRIIERYSYAKKWYEQFKDLKIDDTETIPQAKTYDQNNAIETILNLARGEVGYKEKASNSNLNDKNANAGSGNYTKYAKELDSMTDWYNGAKNGYAWCDIFYDWLFYKCFGTQLGRQMICQPAKSCGAGCLYSAQYYKQSGRWFTSPQPGDQVFFTYNPGEYSHTGIVESVSNGMVVTIEGNTTDSVGRRTYPIGSSNIAGYGRPKWDLITKTPITSSPVDYVNDGVTDAYAMLRKGSKGDDVKWLQEHLIKLGYDVGPDGADGDFGYNTEKAVIAFQTAYQLEVDGIAGSETKKKLSELVDEKESKPAPTEDPENPAVPKDSITLPEIKMDCEDNESSFVKLAQVALSCWGYTIIISGIFGKEMDQKVRDFQEKKGLVVDGEIGKETWKALLNLNY